MKQKPTKPVNADQPLAGIKPYDGPAGGWGALQAVAKALRGQMAVSKDTYALFKVNQPQGFDCPGCAWPDPKHASSFEFCENGAKAVSWEATSKRTDAAFFASHTVTELWDWDDFSLEDQGRLTEPMRYDAASDRYLPVSWDEAFAQIGQALRALPHADMAEFYTSGRCSNEAAFLLQLFVREFGTNNFPDCSNMCHEATSVGLPQSIGIGKGTVTLDDFEHCDAIFCVGHNPGTNHPRMLGTLQEAAKRGVPIVVFNPMRERGLERFANPQDAVEMATYSSTKLASAYYQIKIGGDSALMQGIMKVVLEHDRAAITAGHAPVIDHAFIAEHTEGFDTLVAALDALDWKDILDASGLPETDIRAIADIYIQAKRVILSYGMGITQHRDGVSNVQQLANLLLMRGNMGREGAGICPLRGHSNVQGDRTVGITELPTPALLDSIEKVYGFTPPKKHGHGVVACVEAIRKGESTVLVCLGGNLAVAMPDPQDTFAAMRRLDTVVHIATKLNRSHLLHAKNMLLLPCLGRTEQDMQAEGPQAVTVEDSMSMVHASRGVLKPASGELRSEAAIVAGMAIATLPQTKVRWQWLVGDYSRIRNDIEKVFPIFKDYNQRILEPGGFRLPVPASERVWKTPSGKAQFLPSMPLFADTRRQTAEALIMATIRSHDQYNTTIYGKNDRYRGISGRRDVIFMNAADLARRGLTHGDLVDVEAIGPQDGSDPHTRILYGLTAVAHDISQGSVAAYYPEANPLIALSDYDTRSGTPAYKSVPVLVRKAAAAAA